MRKTSEYERQICKHTKHFTEVLCIKSGLGFIKGDIYALGEATNNGLYILGSNLMGEPINLLVHCIGDQLTPPDMGGDVPVFEIIA